MATPQAASDRFKVIIVGDSGVGKSSIAQRQCRNSFEVSMNPTIGSAHSISTIQIGDRPITMVLWDTAGQEEFQSLVPMYSRRSHCALIVGEATNASSISHMTQWVERLHESEERPPMIAVINKIDLLPEDNGELDKISKELHEKFSSIYFVSAKTGRNVSELFLEVAQKCIAASPGRADSQAGPKEKEGGQKCGC